MTDRKEVFCTQLMVGCKTLNLVQVLLWDYSGNTSYCDQSKLMDVKLSPQIRAHVDVFVGKLELFPDVKAFPNPLIISHPKVFQQQLWLAP